MNDFETELQRIRQELHCLAQDLGSTTLYESTDWAELVSAIHSLGREIRVPRIDLAAEFLGVFAEQQQLLERIRLQRRTDRYFLEQDEEVEDLSRRIVRDNSFVTALVPRLVEDAKNWQLGQVNESDDISPFEDTGGDDMDTLADHILQQTIEVERERLLGELISGSVAVFPGKVKDFNQGFRDAIGPSMSRLSLVDFKALSRWLKSYRRTTLNYTWLSPSRDSETPIEHLTTLMKNHESYSFGWLTQLSNDPEYAELGDAIYGIWDQLAGLFGQMDFDDIIEDLKGGFHPFGPDGDHQINIIPGEEKLACKRILLVFTKGSDEFAFENVMRDVKEHVVDCIEVLKLVVIVTDTWDSKKFMNDHFGHFAAFRRKNIRFLFIGVGAPRDQIAPIAVDLT